MTEGLSGGVTARLEYFSSVLGDTKLVAVSKRQPPQKILEAVEAGQRIFGENRVQEAYTHWEGYRETVPDLELHLIGSLQTNKVKEAMRFFDVIETVDREKLAVLIGKELGGVDSRLRGNDKEKSWNDKEKSGNHNEKRENDEEGGKNNDRAGIRLRKCFVQVNTGEEAQKSGIYPGEADDFIEACKYEWGVPVVGLMCIPPVEDYPGPHFALLREMAKRHGLPELSMGMSGDYMEAVRFGATQVRVGSALFGERE